MPIICELYLDKMDVTTIFWKFEFSRTLFERAKYIPSCPYINEEKLIH